jgi:hypothetical protein
VRHWRIADPATGSVQNWLAPRRAREGKLSYSCPAIRTALAGGATQRQSQHHADAMGKIRATVPAAHAGSR